MIIYADVLIFLNMFVNFFILLLTAGICKEGYKSIRLIISSLTGALFSLYIFLPQSIFAVEVVFKVVISAIMVLTAFGFDSLKCFLRRSAVFFAASFLFGGSMLAICSLVHPKNMTVNNGILYINISPMILISTTLISYFVLSTIRHLGARHAGAGDRCEIEIFNNSNHIELTALIDTGNSLTDTLTDRPVIIAEKSVAEILFPVSVSIEAVATGSAVPGKGFRVIPYTSVGGHGLLPAFACERVIICYNKQKVTAVNTLVALSNEKLGEDYNAIISPELLP